MPNKNVKDFSPVSQINLSTDSILSIQNNELKRLSDPSATLNLFRVNANNLVYNTTSQTISGTKTFVTRPRVGVSPNFSGVVLDGDVIRPNFNTTIGFGAGLNTIYSLMSGNTAAGYNALRTNTSGQFNTAIGVSSLFSLNSGNSNTSIGVNAGYLLNNGSNNIILGGDALSGCISGNDNTAIGISSLKQNLGGSNIAIGFRSAESLVTGNNNIFIGVIANTASNIPLGVSNSIAIGREAVVSGNNQLSIGSINFPITTATTANAASITPPATIERYLVINLNGILGKIPVYKF